jgi:hypothetical protein
MTESFISFLVKGIGTTPQTVFIAGEKTVLVGCNTANTTKYDLPFNLFIERDSEVFYIVKELPCNGGRNVEVIQGKLLLMAGDILKTSSALDNSFDIAVSVLSGVS